MAFELGDDFLLASNVLRAPADVIFDLSQVLFYERPVHIPHSSIKRMVCCADCRPVSLPAQEVWRLTHGAQSGFSTR